MLSEFNLPRLKHLKYLKWHNPMESKQTKHQRPQLKSYGAMKQKMIYWTPNKTSKTTTQKLWSNEVEDDLLTPHTSYLNRLTMKRKPPLERHSIVTPTSKGRRQQGVERKIETSNLKTSTPCQLPTNLIKANPWHFPRVNNGHKPIKGDFLPILWWMIPR